MEVLQYSPLWQRPSNACGVCSPKYVDLQYSNYFIEEFAFLYIVVDGDKYRLTRDNVDIELATYLYENTNELIVVDEQGNVENLPITFGCNYEYGYATLTDFGYFYQSIQGLIQFVEVEGNNCKPDKYFLVKYKIGCTDLEWITVAKGAVNRIPSQLADEGVGILPNGQARRYYARIDNRFEIRLRDMNETDLDLFEFAFNQPFVKLFSFSVVYNIAEGSVFTFDQESYGIYFGIVEVSQSTMLIQQCCDIQQYTEGS